MGIDRTALSAAMKQLPATPRATLAHPPSPESHPLERSPSPASHPRKRRREEDSDDNESSDDDENNNTTHRLTPSTPGHSQATPGTSQSQVPDRFSSTNLSAFTEKECKRAKLDASETADVQEFSKLATEKKLTKIYTKLLATQKKLVKLEDDKNVWEGPSKALRGNIAKYAHAVLLSPNLHGYREKVPINHVLTIIKRLRFDLPCNVEKNRSHWATVETAVSNALTSKRWFFKDEVKHSGANDLDIYTLTERIIGDSEVNMSLELVACISKMQTCLIYTFSSGVSCTRHPERTRPTRPSIRSPSLNLSFLSGAI
ncbi:hypothetical protein A0H81_01425 [Grifola frondosa]|uniref:Uncharacterized protein n=1 Tax=Grifola frondosa TaxID=5627 RepID=A0A1C7LMJ8_GRIFR|nr:hypothetical protein A0H81_14214 [Grifola frondosa]OBZ66015.1 hypothetical protein A0H81_14015 [Grifola frondosa]OBZ79126.1 hypothetical protein A0H81_01425 [Grifola frondosa]